MKTDVFIVAVICCCQFVQGQPLGSRDVTMRISELISPDRDARHSAANSLKSMQKDLHEALLQNLKSFAPAPPRIEFEGPLYSAIGAVGTFRDVDCVDELIPLLTTVVDPLTLPHGIRPADGTFYPAASVLAKIGGRDVRDAIFAQLRKENSRETEMVIAWILSKDLGRNLSRLAVEDHISGAQSEVEKRNLTEVREILADSEVILPRPSSP